MVITDGKVLAETVNLQVVKVKRCGGSICMVQHFATEETIPLLELLSGTRRFSELVMSDNDAAALERCKKYLRRSKPKITTNWGRRPPG